MNKKDKWQAVYNHYQATKKQVPPPMPVPPPAPKVVKEKKYQIFNLDNNVQWGDFAAPKQPFPFHVAAEELPLELQPAPKKIMPKPPIPIPGRLYRVINQENTWVEKKQYTLYKVWIPSLEVWSAHKLAILSCMGFDEARGDLWQIFPANNDIWEFEKEVCYE